MSITIKKGGKLALGKSGIFGIGRGRGGRFTVTTDTFPSSTHTSDSFVSVVLFLATNNGKITPELVPGVTENLKFSS